MNDRPYTSDALPQVIYYKHGFRYVASSSRAVPNHNFYYDLERRSQELETSLKGSRSSKQTNKSSEQGSQKRYQIRLTRMPGRYYGGTFYPATSKTVYFVLNGNPSQIHRCLLNPSKPLDLDVILEEVSQALGVAIFKIYSYEGERITSMERLLDLRDNRVIAVGRNDKLVLQGRSFSDLEKGNSRNLSHSLPPIHSAGNGFTSRNQRPSLRYLSQQQNSIERPGKYKLPSTSAIAPTLSRKQYIAALASSRETDSNPAKRRRSASQPRYVRNSEKQPQTSSRLANGRLPNYGRSGRKGRDSKNSDGVRNQKDNVEDGSVEASRASKRKNIELKSSGNNGNDRTGQEHHHTLTNMTSNIGKTTPEGLNPASDAASNLLKTATETTTILNTVHATPPIITETKKQGRPRSINHLQSSHNSSETNFDKDTNHYFAGHDGDDEIEEEDGEYDEHEVESLESDYPEPPDVEDGGREDSREREGNGLIGKDNIEESHGKDGQDNDDDNGSNGDNESNRRGSKTTKNGLNDNIGLDNDVNDNKEEYEDIATMVKSATAIQAGFRGFLARRKLKDTKPEDGSVISDTVVDDLHQSMSTSIENDEKVETARHLEPMRHEDLERASIPDEDAADSANPVNLVHDEDDGLPDNEGHSDEKRETAEKNGQIGAKANENDDKTSEGHDKNEDSEKSTDEKNNLIEESEAAESQLINDENKQPETADALENQPSTSKQAEEYRPLDEVEDIVTVDGDELEKEKDPDQRSEKYYFKLQDVNELEGHDDGSTEDDEDDQLLKRNVDPEDVETYTVVVKLGNRWAADSETELFVQFYGEKGESEKSYIRNQYVNWLEVDGKSRDSSNTFRVQVPCKFLGILQRITVGHDSVGYGAGVFIDTVMVTENAVNGRAFLFQCYKWFDSGQVDGKLVRTMKLTAYCEMYSVKQASQRMTKGRWQVTLRSGDHAGNGGTTSNLLLVGTGTLSSSAVRLANEKSLQNVPSETMMQADFGGIGELLKLRVEIDGEGDEPNYCLHEVELRDLDTQERCVIPCAKWLKWQHTQKGDQPFREVMTFRLGMEALPLIHYEGRVHVYDQCLSFVEHIGRMELIGDLGQTGCIFVDFANLDRKSKKPEISFKFEALSVGKLHRARFYLEPKTNEAEQLFNGFGVLQNIWDRHLNGSLSQHTLGTSGNEWLLGDLTVREGQHVPFKYVLSASKVRPRESDDEPYVLELRVSAMEGMSTRLKKSKAPHRSPSAWFLSMALSEHSNLMPTITLCGKNYATEMHPISQTATDRMISFQNREKRKEVLAAVAKVRVTVAKDRFMKFASDQEFNPTEPMLHIMKMRLVDNANGDEVRFPVANVIVTPDAGIVEFPVAWPDKPPLLNLLYDIEITTGASTLPLKAEVKLNLFGDMGDTAARILVPNDRTTPFRANSTSSFNFEAVSIGLPKTVEVAVTSKAKEFIWECNRVVIKSSIDYEYVFVFQKPFTAITSRQAASLFKIEKQEA
ncbi:unnamed protein product [Bursaphelenchus okinawaensis]|uniref:Uncharacterized protein n=1 Tax=Bursaphelenchus okinawaensis TaxID=465554 RepID=A0A811JRI8_9BILA|nr:unnamed protein product [Bursaphelenchus okinawaensis]CAG9079086.1 unnamed protein product [Bursaphelenchus okinawaensis]